MRHIGFSSLLTFDMSAEPRMRIVLAGNLYEFHKAGIESETANILMT